MEFFKIDRRPWGVMLKCVHTKRFWMKFIFVTGRTSLQSHNRRTEYHIGTKGIQKITPLQVHRMTKGAYIEFAFGLPSENDIVRYEDDYGRK